METYSKPYTLLVILKITVYFSVQLVSALIFYKQIQSNTETLPVIKVVGTPWIPAQKYKKPRRPGI